MHVTSPDWASTVIGINIGFNIHMQVGDAVTVTGGCFGELWQCVAGLDAMHQAQLTLTRISRCSGICDSAGGTVLPLQDSLA